MALDLAQFEGLPREVAERMTLMLSEPDSDISPTSPLDVADAVAVAGMSPNGSAADHVHAHGARGGGTLHAAATTGAAGFHSATDKTRSDALWIAGFGDGSDGNVTIAAGVTAISRDMFYNNLTLQAGAILATENFRVFVKGTFAGDATALMGCPGQGGVGAVGGTATALGSLGCGANGGNGGAAGGAGAAGSGTQPSVGASGGTGGTATAGGAGGAAGAAVAPLGGAGVVRNPAVALTWTAWDVGATVVDLLRGGAGGGGGGADGANAGGGGGSGGGCVFICANEATFAGTITAAGADGDAGTAGNAGGGAGGGGGAVVLLCRSRPVMPTMSAAGGDGGAGAGTGAAGAAGTEGQTRTLFV